MYDDRAMYRPGEEVHLKGWLRVLDPGEGGDVMGVAGQVDEVTFKVIGPRGNDLTTGKARSARWAASTPPSPSPGRPTWARRASSSARAA